MVGAGDELDAHAVDGDAEAGFELGEELGGESLHELFVEVRREVGDAAVVGDEVGVAGDIGVVSAGSLGVAGGEAVDEPAGGEGVEGVVDGGEADAGVGGVEDGVEFLGRGVGGGGGEGLVDEFALARAAEPGLLDAALAIGDRGVAGFVGHGGSECGERGPRSLNYSSVGRTIPAETAGFVGCAGFEPSEVIGAEDEALVRDAGFVERRALGAPAELLVEGAGVGAGGAEEFGEPEFAEGAAFDGDDELSADALAAALDVDDHLLESADARVWVVHAEGGGRDDAGARGMVGDGDEVLGDAVDPGLEVFELLDGQAERAEERLIAESARLGVERVVVRDASDVDHRGLRGLGGWPGGSSLAIRGAGCRTRDGAGNEEVWGRGADWLRRGADRGVMAGKESERWDPRELLYERCGYSIEGLEEDGECPECGERSVGTTYGTAGSAWSPRRVIGELLDARHDRLAPFLTLLAMGAFAVLPLGLVSHARPGDANIIAVMAWLRVDGLVLALVVGLAIAACLCLLLLLAWAGLLLVGRVRSASVDSRRAKDVCYASAAGFVLALLTYAVVCRSIISIDMLFGNGNPRATSQTRNLAALWSLPSLLPGMVLSVVIFTIGTRRLFADRGQEGTPARPALQVARHADLRIGSPWQQSKRRRNWLTLRTALLMIKRPGLFFERVRLDRERVQGMAEDGLLFAPAGLLAIGGGAVLTPLLISLLISGASGFAERGVIERIVGGALPIGMYWGVCLGCFAGLHIHRIKRLREIEERDNTPAAEDKAVVVCAHASLVWTPCTLVVGMAWICAIAADVLSDTTYSLEFRLAPVVTTMAVASSVVVPIMAWLLYRYLGLIGMRVCRSEIVPSTDEPNQADSGV